MSDRNKQIRAEVLEALKDVVRHAKKQGLDGSEAARRAFPGTPEGVIAAAWWDVEEEAEAAWWDSVERTIDAEVIKRALVANGNGGQQ